MKIIDTQAEVEEINGTLPTEPRAGLFIKRIVFNEQTSIELEDNSIVVLVGPNNSGKSLSLREIYNHAGISGFIGRSVSSIEVQRVGDEKKLFETLTPYRAKSEGFFYRSGSDHQSISEDSVRKLWNSDASYIGELADFFIGHLTTEHRLADCLNVENFDALRRPHGSHPVHSLYSDSKLEAKISDLFSSAFDTDLIIHRNGGRYIPIYVGKRPTFNDNEHLVSRSYLDKIEKLDRLESQGDGLKSFSSILLRVWTGFQSIILLDEPEAFLHPPQARAIGELVSAGSRYQRQIFIATHSNDVIQGLLSKFAERVSVVRLQRFNGKASSTLLPSRQIAELWRDPILRYSNILNGLFHNRVVVTESDGDCRFYEAISDVLPRSLETTFYTYSGGKDRIPVIVRALLALHVTTVTIVDFDIFADDRQFRNLVEAYNLDWSDFEKDVNNIRKIIQSKKSWLIGSGFKARIIEVVNEIEDDSIVDKKIMSRMRVLMREASPWDTIKGQGMAAVPPGEPTKNVQQLIHKLDQAGIFVVPEGEMEGFCRSVGRHGPRWVEEVLNRDLSSDPELERARVFVKNINSISLNQSSYSNLRNNSSLRFNHKDYYRLLNIINLLLRNIGNLLRSLMFLAITAYLILQILRMSAK